MQLDTTIMQTKTVTQLVDFINQQNDIILAMRAEVDSVDADVETLIENSIRRTELINARQVSAEHMLSDRKIGGSQHLNRRENGRIKF